MGFDCDISMDVPFIMNHYDCDYYAFGYDVPTYIERSSDDMFGLIVPTQMRKINDGYDVSIVQWVSSKWTISTEMVFAPIGNLQDL